MNKDILKGKWKQATGELKSRWGKLTDDDIQTLDGEREKLVGKLQERYGLARDAAEKQVLEFESRL